MSIGNGGMGQKEKVWKMELYWVAFFTRVIKFHLLTYLGVITTLFQKKNTQLYFVMWRLHPVHVSTRVFALNE